MMSKNSQNDKIRIALIQQALANIEKKVDVMDGKLSNSFLTKEEFEVKFSPVRNIVYGMVAVILLAVITALVALVVIPKV